MKRKALFCHFFSQFLLVLLAMSLISTFPLLAVGGEGKKIESDTSEGECGKMFISRKVFDETEQLVHHTFVNGTCTLINKTHT